MRRTALTIDEANGALQQLVDMPVSVAWKGAGTTIFLELGTVPAGERQRHPTGEVTIRVGWDWRIEEGNRVLLGSSDSRPDIGGGIATLVGSVVMRATIQGMVPELTIVFSNGSRLQSATMCSDAPAWSIRLPGQVWIRCDDGIVYAGDGTVAVMLPDEEAIFDHADATAQRWGFPAAPAPAGRCGACTQMRCIDASGALLDYGVCTSASSPLDGRVVNMDSGCAAFLASRCPA